MTIKKVGVIGAGQMGSGIAHVCALAGYDVGLYDISKEAIETGLATINGNMARQVRSDKITEDERKAALERISPASKFEQFGDMDLIIESAVEDEEVKRKIFHRALPAPQGKLPDRLEHVVDLHHPAGRRY
jgi:3-hydroxybutyryl-CoA dehydrogenase